MSSLLRRRPAAAGLALTAALLLSGCTAAEPAPSSSTAPTSSAAPSPSEPTSAPARASISSPAPVPSSSSAVPMGDSASDRKTETAEAAATRKTDVPTERASASPAAPSPGPAASSSAAEQPSQTTAAPDVVEAAGATAEPTPEGPTAPVAPAGPTDGDAATVLWVTDGDTIVVDLEGEQTRVRLLNIDSPETKHPTVGRECLGQEATAALTGMLSVGEKVVLKYDDVLHDRYGRLLAGVFDDGVLVNAEMARLGLAEPVQYDGNVRFLPPVELAWREATAAGAGLTSGACAAPASAATPQAQTWVAPAPAPAPAPASAPAPAAAGGAGPVTGSGKTCPASHPVKANDNSGIYHVPGQQHYGVTNSRNCYASASAAVADGYRAAKR